jgi:hypothetical protein
MHDRRGRLAQEQMDPKNPGKDAATGTDDRFKLHSALTLLARRVVNHYRSGSWTNVSTQYRQWSDRSNPNN